MDSRILDANACWLGVSRLHLMENAGKEIAKRASKYGNIAVFAGTGNNGGDGLAAARHLIAAGKKVKIYAVEGKRTPECQKNLDILSNTDARPELIRDSKELDGVCENARNCDLIIDALLGVGAKGRLREPVKTAVDCINKLKGFKLSVDAPSGDDKTRVNADETISLHTAKTPDAKVVDIGIPKEAELYCGPGDVCAAIPERNPDAHKGDYGRLLVVGGSERYVGAPYLAAWAAMRSGVDICVVCTPNKVAERMHFNPNLIIQPLKSKDRITEEDVDYILNQEYDAMVVGNGLGLEPETKEAVRELLSKNKKPAVVDADALRLLKPEKIKANMVLTPHGGEFRHLCPDDEGDATEAAEKFSKKTKAVVVLKGRVDVVSDGLTTRLNKTGNPGMTVGGTGDTLAGIVGGLLAQNRDPMASACAGAFLNGLAGDRAYARLDVSMTATDLIEEIPEAIKQCRSFM